MAKTSLLSIGKSSTARPLAWVKLSTKLCDKAPANIATNSCAQKRPPQTASQNRPHQERHTRSSDRASNGAKSNNCGNSYDVHQRRHLERIADFKASTSFTILHTSRPHGDFIEFLALTASTHCPTRRRKTNRERGLPTRRVSQEKRLRKPLSPFA